MNLETSERPRILSGMRPTGRLHLGNLVGALQNWVKLQDKYDSFHFVADWHMLTTDYEDTLDLRQNTWEMVADWLACGLDPTKATFFVQSRLPEHAELHLLFSMVTPLGWLERVPTYKEQLENIKDRDINTYGFLGYPLLQAADILMYKAALRSCGRRPGSARGADARSRAAVQPSFWQARSEETVLPGVARLGRGRRGNDPASQRRS